MFGSDTHSDLKVRVNPSCAVGAHAVRPLSASLWRLVWYYCTYNNLATGSCSIRFIESLSMVCREAGLISFVTTYAAGPCDDGMKPL